MDLSAIWKHEHFKIVLAYFAVKYGLLFMSVSFTSFLSNICIHVMVLNVKFIYIYCMSHFFYMDPHLPHPSCAVPPSRGLGV